MATTETKSIVRGVRLSADKGRLVADLIRGKKVDQALNILTFTPRKAAVIVKKALESAIANAEHNDGADIDELKVKSIYVEQGATLKRFRARAKGRGARILKRTIDEDTAKMESGLTILASIGSTAPFVGLLGTVWGIYHALVAIGMSGAGTLDKVAGPVGEALIMTAIGLAVAIPAVLGYNFIVRANRLTLSRLDSFAHDLFTFLTTGAKIEAQIGAANVAPLKRA